MNRKEMQNKINKLKADIEVLENELKNMDSKGWKPSEGETYYCVTAANRDWTHYEKNNPLDNKLISIGNYFKTKEEAERVQFEQNLRLKLRKFAEDNDDKTDWNNCCEGKYFIDCDYSNEEIKLYTATSFCIRDFGQIYFSSRKLVEEAIELFHDDLIKYFEEE